MLKMSSFIAKTNASTGKMEWVEQNEEYDYHQEVARSAYGDMLHDKERNELYEKAISKAIKEVHAGGRPANVLDIGTGTGLLSMMAVKHGADRAVACEAFRPIADCASRVLEANNLRDRIRIIPRTSHSLTAEDIGGRANILVAEVFDTELIGEGALDTFTHATHCLMEDDSIVIPSSAVIVAQPVSCDFLKSWGTFEDVCFEDHPEGRATDHDLCRMCIRPPDEVKNCFGVPCVHDVQLDNLKIEQFVSIANPQTVFRFDFTREMRNPKSIDVKRVEYEAVSDGKVDCIFMWWELYMDKEETVVLSTAPYWEHPRGSKKQWRDHWMQGVYFPPHPIEVTKGERFHVIAHHDEFSVWFDTCKRPAADSETTKDPDQKEEEEGKKVISCTCGVHMGCSRGRVATMNDPRRNRIYFQALKKAINKDSVCLAFGDYSLLPIMAAMLGAKKVYAVQPHSVPIGALQMFVDANGLTDKIKVFNCGLEHLKRSDFCGDTIDTIIAEPYFSTSMLPWENLRFLYTRADLEKVSEVPTQLPPLLSEKLTIIPQSATIKGVAVEFRDLHKVKGSPVGTCQGFDLRPFDELVHNSSQLADGFIESHPLWEYPCEALTPEFELLYVNFVAPVVGSVRQQERDGFVEFSGAGTCNGIAIWIEYNFDEDQSDMAVSSGPTSPVEANRPIEWDPYSKQAVRFFDSPMNVQGRRHRLKHHTIFNLREPSFSFTFASRDSHNAGRCWVPIH